MLVDREDGDSQFTTDPSRHRIMEAFVNIPDDVETANILPERETADILVQAYFINVCDSHPVLILFY